MGFYEVKSKATKEGIGIRAVKGSAARNVPVAYTVKNGITRLVWEEAEGDIVAGTTLFLGTGRHSAAAGNVGDYLLVAGGTSTYPISSVERFNSSLVLGTAASLSAVTSSINAAKTSNYLLFAYKYSDTSTNHIDVFSTALAKTSISSLTFNDLGYAETGSLDGKAFIFDIYGNQLSIINNSLTEISRTTIAAKIWSTTVSMEKHIIVAGASNSTAVFAVDSAGTVIGLASLVTSKYQISGAFTGKHAIFAAGYAVTNTTYFKDVIAYDTALTKMDAAALANAKEGVGSARLGNRAIFAGGYTYLNGTQTYFNDAVSYDGTLTQKAVANLYRASRNMACGSIGKNALFIGGATQTKYAGDTPVSVYKLQ